MFALQFTVKLYFCFNTSINAWKLLINRILLKYKTIEFHSGSINIYIITLPYFDSYLYLHLSMDSDSFGRFEMHTNILLIWCKIKYKTQLHNKTIMHISNGMKPYEICGPVEKMWNICTADLKAKLSQRTTQLLILYALLTHNLRRTLNIWSVS